MSHFYLTQVSGYNASLPNKDTIWSCSVPNSEHGARDGICYICTSCMGWHKCDDTLYMSEFTLLHLIGGEIILSVPEIKRLCQRKEQTTPKPQGWRWLAQHDSSLQKQAVLLTDPTLKVKHGRSRKWYS